MNVHCEYDSLYDQEMKQFVLLLDALAGLRQLLTVAGCIGWSTSTANSCWMHWLVYINC